MNYDHDSDLMFEEISSKNLDINNPIVKEIIDLTDSRQLANKNRFFKLLDLFCSFPSNDFNHTIYFINACFDGKYKNEFRYFNRNKAYVGSITPCTVISSAMDLIRQAMTYATEKDK